MAVRRQDQPPAPGPEMYVRRLRSGEKWQGTVLGTKLHGFWTHWDGRRSLPCEDDRKGCSGCKRGLPQKWKGYLHVGNEASKREEFLEITPSTAKALESQLGADAPIRGARFVLERMKGDNARLKLTLLPACAHTAGLPSEKDPLKTLEKLWGSGLRLMSSCEPTQFDGQAQVG